MQLTTLRLSSHQVSLLLSSIWVQAINAENAPANFEAMANAYYIALVFSRSKAANHIALVRCFQLAFSAYSAGLQPSRRRSLFTLSSCMLLFSAKAGDVQELIPFVQASLKAETLVEEVKLLDVHVKSDVKKMVYGSEEDDAAALISLSSVEANDQLLKETVISHFSTKLSKLSEDEMVEIKQQLLLGFSPDDAYPLGGPLFMETPRPCSPLNQLDIHSLQEVILEAALTDDEVLTEANGSHSDRKTSLSANTADILSVHELLDSMMTQCEALVSGKQQKMSMLHSFKHQHDTSRIFPSEDERKSNTEVDTVSSIFSIY
ncbi:Protein SEMI-ROLLED LEAF 2 [Linum grandiflorum]